MSNVTKDQVLQALKNVIDPDLNRDIVELGFIKQLQIDKSTVSFSIELTTPACPVKDELQAQAKQHVASLSGVENVHITMTSRVRSVGAQQHNFLPQVKNIIPVASGKGGVGKSTVSVNLALALVDTGAKVGIMDADVYGPSVPTLLNVENPQIKGIDNKMFPIEQYGLKIMSMGFFLPSDKAAVWRGPMLDKMITQFLGGVEWGELDYLIIDLPPGTGDVHLSICQKLSLTGAVVVSTPQKLALNVAQKAVFMFQQLNCPILGIIENMSYYLGANGEKEDIFGSGGGKEISENLKVPFLGEIPLDKKIRLDCDAGKPTVYADKENVGAQAFVEAAKQMAAQASIQNINQEDIKVTF
jgi:ATP-binding protein involved in chromosome partitioning